MPYTSDSRYCTTGPSSGVNRVCAATGGDGVQNVVGESDSNHEVPSLDVSSGVSTKCLTS